MADNQGVYLSYEELQNLMKAAVGEAVREAVKPNWLDQKRIDEETAKLKRREALAIELGYADEQKKWNHQHSCGHSRDKETGADVARGMGKWTTGGQILSDGSVYLLCLRCGT